MKNWGWVLVMAVMLLLTACAPEPLMSMSVEDDMADLAIPENDVGDALEKVDDSLPPVVLTEDNNGETITIQVGQELHIFLGGNPTTGYMWASRGLDSKFLALAEEPAYTAASDAIGSGGEFDFFFTMKAPGKTLVTLEYKRSFEKDVEPERTFSLKLVIEE